MDGGIKRTVEEAEDIAGQLGIPGHRLRRARALLATYGCDTFSPAPVHDGRVPVTGLLNDFRDPLRRRLVFSGGAEDGPGGPNVGSGSHAQADSGGRGPL